MVWMRLQGSQALSLGVSLLRSWESTDSAKEVRPGGRKERRPWSKTSKDLDKGPIKTRVNDSQGSSTTGSYLLSQTLRIRHASTRHLSISGSLTDHGKGVLGSWQQTSITSEGSGKRDHSRGRTNITHSLSSSCPWQSHSSICDNKPFITPQVSRRGDILYQQGRPTLWIDWRKIALVSCIEGSISPAYIGTIYGRSIARGDFLFSRLSQAVNKESGNPCDRIQKCQLFHL